MSRDEQVAAQPPRSRGILFVFAALLLAALLDQLVGEQLLCGRAAPACGSARRGGATALRDGLWLLATMLAVIGVALALIEVFYG